LRLKFSFKNQISAEIASASVVLAFLTSAGSSGLREYPNGCRRQLELASVEQRSLCTSFAVSTV